MNKAKIFSVVICAAVAAAVLPAVHISSVVAYADEEEKDYTIGYAGWNDESGAMKAEWDPAESSTRYKLQLYRTSTSNKVGNAVTTSGTKHDFSSAISNKGTGTYFYIITPVKGGSDYAVVSEEIEIDSDMMTDIRSYLKERKEAQKAAAMAPGNPHWVMNPNGTWQYLQNDGTYVKSNWAELDGKWYYFGSDALMKTGWQKIKNYWFYFGTDGALWVNTTTPDGYTVNGDGVWIDPNTGSAVDTGSSSTTQAPVQSNIDTVRLNLQESSVEPGKIRNAEVRGGSNVTVNNVTYSKPYEQWTISDTITITVEISANNETKFTNTTKYSLGNTTMTGSSGDEKNRTLTFSYTPKMTLKTPENLYITTDNVLKWTKVENAHQYRVVISYVNEEDESSSKTLTVTKAEADLSDYIDAYEDISIRVTAQAAKKDKSRISDSSAATIEDLRTFQETNTLDGTFKTTGDSVYYRDEDGDKAKGWQELAGYWYYFKSNGNAVDPGWFQDEDGTWYYFDSDHRMMTGKITDNGTEYFLNDGTYPDLPTGAWVENP